MTSRVALDGGQSGCRGRDGRGHLWQGVGIDTSKPRIPQLAAAVRAAAPEGVDRVLVGTTGLGVEDTAAALLAELADHGTREVFLAHDSVTSYLGALGDRTGCVVAAGTGVVTLGVGATRAVRVDGWGWILGDAGSGFWIGRRAIDMALRAFDGRGPETALLDLVRADFGDPALAYLILQGDPRRVARTAAYARHVDELAPTDEVAAQVLRDAAAELVTSVTTGLRLVDGHAEDPVCVLGNVFRSATLSSAFAAGIAELAPTHPIVPAGGTGLDGADLLDQVETGLVDLVDVARL
ncbi:MAG TPA: BadF/BadG/BcrA/BcrD ATPase family protein [Propionibacteriaceae bacterium]|nr:BadF/BadG/BcrA/BcrD ATPase family protein [Propionibacteriaceae bacterium]